MAMVDPRFKKNSVGVIFMWEYTKSNTQPNEEKFCMQNKKRALLRHLKMPWFGILSISGVKECDQAISCRLFLISKRYFITVVNGGYENGNF
jgi:hypothetical protein